jgi:serine/threonine-protein kinase
MTSLQSLNTLYLSQATIAAQNNHIQSVTAMQTTLASGALIPSDQLATLQSSINTFVTTAHGEIHTASSAQASSAQASAAQASSAQAFQASAAQASRAQASSAQASSAQASSAQASAAQASAAQAFQASAAQASSAQASSAQASAAQASSAQASSAQASSAQASSAQASSAQASSAQASSAQASSAQASSAQASSAQASQAQVFQASAAQASSAQASRAQASSAQASSAQASSAQASSAQASAAQATPGFVSTFAGRPGVSAYSDGTIAEATFSLPSCIAIDGGNNVIVSDLNNHRIRKITPQGVVTTLAGSGNAAFGDGSLLSASFSGPQGVACDRNSAYVYVADTQNHRIRRVHSRGGEVTTIAGSGNPAYAEGNGAAASFNSPTGVAVDENNTVFVADRNNNRIRKITSLGVVTTLAGSGTAAYADGRGTAASFNSPTDVALDAQGNVIVADTGNNCIRMITPDGVVTTIAGDMTFVRPAAPQKGGGIFSDGFANEALFDRPMGVSVDAANNIYVADSNNGRIRKITEGNVTTIAGNGIYSFADGMSTNSSFRRVRDVAVDKNGDVYAADSENHVIRRITKMATSVAEASAAQASQAQVSAAQASMASGPKASAAQASSAQASSAQASRAEASSAQAFQASSAQASSAQASSAQASSAQASSAQASQAQASAAAASGAAVVRAQIGALSDILKGLLNQIDALLSNSDLSSILSKWHGLLTDERASIIEMQRTLSSGQMVTITQKNLDNIQGLINTTKRLYDEQKASSARASSAQASSAQASQAQASSAQASSAQASQAQASSAQASSAQASSALASAAQASGAAVTNAQIQGLTESLKSLNDLNTQYLSSEYLSTLETYKKTITSWIASLSSGSVVQPDKLATFKNYMEEFLDGANEQFQTASAAQVSGANASAAQVRFQASAAQAQEQFQASAAQAQEQFQASAAQVKTQADAQASAAQVQASAAQVQAQLQASAAQVQAQLQASAAQAQAQPRPVPAAPVERQYGEDSEVILGEEIDTTVPKAETQYGEADNFQEEEEPAEEAEPQEGGRIKKRRTSRKSTRRKRGNKITAKNKKRYENKKSAR